jgi:hypothetical protein
MNTPPVYFYDPGNIQYRETRRNWERLESAGVMPSPIELTNNENDNVSFTDAGRSVRCSGAFVCLVHASRLNSLNETVRRWARAHPVARFIVISGRAPTSPADVLENALYYRGTVGQDIDKDIFRERIHSWYIAWSKNSNYCWRPLDQDNSPILALRLLCDAWVMNRDASSERLHASHCHNGITVNAPIKPGDWFLPFGKDLKNKTASETSLEIEDIASHMGDAKNEVRVFFEKIAGHFRIVGIPIVDRAAFEQDILKLVEKLNSIGL